MAHPPLYLLPNELLQEICAIICPHCSYFLDPSQELPHTATERRKDLLSLCKTSRRLHGIASVFLYHMFPPAGAESHTVDGRWRQLGMVRRMHRRPDLAACVRHADFQAYVWRGPEPRAADIGFAVDEPPPCELPSVPGIAPGGGWAPRPIGEDHWVAGGANQQGARQRQFPVEFPIWLTPNLECLHIEMPGRGWDTEWSRLPPFELPALERLYLSFRDTRHGSYFSPAVGLDRAGGLVERAPSLRLLFLDLCRTVPPGLDLAGITVLALRDSNIGEKGAVDLFATMTNLQALCYTDICTYPSLTPRCLTDALRPAAGTLRYLKVDYDTGDKFGDRKDVIASLKAFSVLETLVVAPCCVYAWDLDEERMLHQRESALAAILPPSLKLIYLTYVPIEILPDLRRFAAVPQLRSFPDLREFSIPSATDEPISLALIDAFRDTGVRFGDFSDDCPSHPPDMEDLLRGRFRHPSRRCF